MADTILTAPPVRAAVPLRAWYIVAAVVAFAVMMAAIFSPSLWFLNFVHVMTGALWTGIDLFMGFIIGPVLRHVSFDTRRAMIGGLIPRTLILMPTLSAITSTSGWFLAVRMGFLDLAYPEFWWVIAALAIVTVLTVQDLAICCRPISGSISRYISRNPIRKRSRAGCEPICAWWRCRAPCRSRSLWSWPASPRDSRPSLVHAYVRKRGLSGQ